MVTFLMLIGLAVVLALFVAVITWDKASIQAFQMWNPWFLRTEVAYYRKNLESQLALNSAQVKKAEACERDLRFQCTNYANRLTQNTLAIAGLNGQLADLRLRVSRDEKTIKRLGVFIEGREIVIDNLIAAESCAREEIAAKDELLKLAQPKVTKKRKK